MFGTGHCGALAATAYDKIEPGTKVRLCCHSYNPHDRNAIGVYLTYCTEGQRVRPFSEHLSSGETNIRIGYVPIGIASVLAKHMDADPDKPWYAIVESPTQYKLRVCA